MVVMSDTCNVTRNTHSIIAEEFNEAKEALCKDDSYNIRVLEVDFWNHYRNVWLGDMTKALSTLFGNTKMGELDEID